MIWVVLMALLAPQAEARRPRAVEEPSKDAPEAGPEPVATPEPAATRSIPPLPLPPDPAQLNLDEAKKHYNLARASYGNGNIHESLEHFLHAYQKGDNPALLYNIGSIYEELGDAENAVLALKRAATEAMQRKDIPSLALDRDPPSTPKAPAPAPAPATPVQFAELPDILARLPTGNKASQDTAVVVGLEDYAFIPDVPHAARDAEAFRSFLLYTRGIPQHRIQHLTAGSRDHIEAAVKTAAAEAGDGGTVWVYFAGHGAASTETGERIILGDDVRADAISLDKRGLPVEDLATLARSGGAKAMMVLDTCYAGVGRGGETLIAGKRFAVPSYAVRAGGGEAHWNAAGPNELSGPLADVDHGAFTYFAVGALRGWADGELSGTRDGKVTAAEAHAFVTRALKARGIRDQQPQWTGEADTNDWVLSEGATELGPKL